MALIIDSSAVTKYTKTPQSLSEVIDMNFYPAGSFLGNFFKIVGGYVAPTDEVFATKLGYTGQASGESDCTTKSDDGTITFSKRVIDTKQISSELFYCLKTLPKNLEMRMSEIKSAWDILGFADNSTLPDSIKYILAKVQMSLSESVLRNAFYGKVTATTSTSTLPGLKNSANIKYYSLISGVVDQMNAVIASNSIRNFNPASYSTALSLLDAVLKKSTPQLRADETKEFWVDKDTFDKIDDELTALDRVSNATVMNGIPMLKYKSIPVYSLEGVEYLFNGDFENNSTDHAAWQPTKVILRPKDGFMIPTIDEKDFAEIKVSFKDDYIKVNDDGTSEKPQEGYVVKYTYSIDSFIGAYELISAAFGKASWAL